MISSGRVRFHTIFIGSRSFLHTWEMDCSRLAAGVLGGIGCHQLAGR